MNKKTENSLYWFEVENPVGKRIPKWQRSTAISNEGVVFVAGAIASNETEILLCASYDGTPITHYLEHIYVPANWLAREFPTTKEFCELLESKTRKFHNALKENNLGEEEDVLSDRAIEITKKHTDYRNKNDIVHEHNDCIRIAYEWLDAQKKTKTISTKKPYPIKHLIEKWAGRYVSTSDVEVAAHIHPEIKGKYPYFNISSNLTEPSKERLKDISEAFTQDYRERHEASAYKIHEPHQL